jgi:alkyl sulfatase BDS1-like metallo-beta-lactamase superfamily hydrolase
VGDGAKPATRATSEINRAALARYAMDDRADFADADRGFIAGFPARLHNDTGLLIRDHAELDFIADDAPAPASVNPGLWRQSQLIKRGGLFMVTEGLYQVRLSASMTIADAPGGLVIIDPGASIDLAKAAMDLFRRHTGNEKPVAAVIYTHTHSDHYGGVKGVVSEDDVTSGNVPIVAPGTIESFNRWAIGEDLITGNAVSRRMSYTSGLMLPRCDTGLVTPGLAAGDELPENTRLSYIAPTDPITGTGQTRTLGGWDFEFLYAPDTEAPEEMHIWIPQIRALTCAENANHSTVATASLRGARTSDARNVARCLDETLVRWGEAALVHFGPHTWPVFGNDSVVAFLEGQRDLYKYVHDQSVRLANHGLDPLEAAEIVRLPDAIGGRYVHGSLRDGVRSVFGRELGFWDGDPATILPLLPADSARRHVALIGRKKILDEGRKAIEAGDYRWAVQVLHHLVFADPDDTQARELQADAYEQLGYQQEAPQYRAIFLTAASELRDGVVKRGQLGADTLDTILAMPVDLLFDLVGVRIIGDKAAAVDIRLNVTFDDTGDEWTMWIRNGVLNARPGHADDAQLTIIAPKADLAALLLQPAQAGYVTAKDALKTEGDPAVLDSLASVIDTFDPYFDVSTP